MELKAHADRLEERHEGLVQAQLAAYEAGASHPFNGFHPENLRASLGIAREIGKMTLEFIRLTPHIREIHLISRGKLPKV